MKSRNPSDLHKRDSSAKWICFVYKTGPSQAKHWWLGIKRISQVLVSLLINCFLQVYLTFCLKTKYTTNFFTGKPVMCQNRSYLEQFSFVLVDKDKSVIFPSLCFPIALSVEPEAFSKTVLVHNLRVFLITIYYYYFFCRPSHTAFTNEFFASACHSWKDRLQDGELHHSLLRHSKYHLYL